MSPVCWTRKPWTWKRRAALSDWETFKEWWLDRPVLLSIVLAILIVGILIGAFAINLTVGTAVFFGGVAVTMIAAIIHMLLTN